MAPQINSVQCIRQTAAGDEDTFEIFDDLSDDEVEYGYLQVDDYRSYFRCAGPKVKRWVPLPRGTLVQTYPSSSNDSSFEVPQCRIASKECHPSSSPNFSLEVQQCRTASKSLRSYSFESECTASTSTSSTVASVRDTRQVHFRDGLLPGCEDAPNSEHGLEASLADCIFIDRDICGFSLHEYDPESSSVADFAASPYAYMFLEELEVLASLNSLKEHMAAQCIERYENYRHEERQLDKALLLAGVHVNCIHAAPEDIQQPGCTRFSI